MAKDGQRINNVATCNEQYSTPQKSNNLINIDEGAGLAIYNIY
jgi:hypothetical protein